MNSTNKGVSRRNFVKGLSLATGACMLPGLAFSSCSNPGSEMKLGLVTYKWGEKWDVPTLIKNCTDTGILGVELRVQHAHGVDLGISDKKIAKIRKQFDDSKVEILGLGTNCEYDSVDPKKLKKNIEDTKEYIRISHKLGASGVKVKPNRLHEGEVPKEETIEQIGLSLNEVAKYAAEYGQQIRVEVHGRQTQQLPIMKAIMDVATHPNVTVCWNCNEQDLWEGGLEHNFNLVKDRFGDTVHVRELNVGEYPYQDLMNLFVKMDYKGWILLECRTDPEDKVKALIEQKQVFEEMIANAQK
jgi:sugar phosphate isomerase/epimerase